ncbi:deoxyuridine 5'-triphosphate nucleotidohydrolase [Chryseobacterium sp. H3056]|uniref:Deoxyuridine 5'-triphosphate nucleotidohydrolase n=1 Tax=Kaistella daneshvariae TaxID=2487074 RepID=A0A3N0WRV7_9FLAO|nr:deoxyuridine 5'-triphosphate nucleotidohydrolase [Kaistella daneshvariae]ROI07655.1 deoxyuridine 5'-triphosphate nucleotidohydrolase [Kaistella daneshvariae]
MEFSKEFKQAISEFSGKEKDKLIFRLLKKDPILAHRLYFELIDPENADDKRLQMQHFIKKEVAAAAKRFGRTKYFLTNIRKISSKITEHVKITSDKFGEVSLNLLLISETLENTSKSGDYYKLYIYLLNKLFRSMILTTKLDEDYFLDLKPSFADVKSQILDNDRLEKITLDNGLFLKWLNPENIPEHIDQIFKDVKAEGLLR